MIVDRCYDFINALSVVVSVVILCFSYRYTKNSELRQRLSESRPVLFISVFGNIDICCKSRRRKGYNRLIALTPVYLSAKETAELTECKYVFLRIRNTSENSAYNIVVDVAVKNQKRILCHQKRYVIDTIRSRTEYMIFLPAEVYEKDNYIYDATVEVAYSSIADERIFYHYHNEAENGNKGAMKVSHLYEGYSLNGKTEMKRKKKRRRTFFMKIEKADAIRTEEVDSV